jgi:hypothetical protein
MSYQYKIDDFFKALTAPKQVPHIKDIKKGLEIIKEHAEDFDENFFVGSCVWKKTIWRERQEYAALLRAEREEKEIMREMRREDREAREMGRWF